MAIELWLNFTDQNGEVKQILVEGEKFAIGRTPDNDLQIPISNLSRQHAQIQRFADVFVVSDLGSSNGTSLNDENLEKPIALKDGDRLNLGGLDIEVEIVSDKDKADKKSGGSAAGDDDEDDEEAGASVAASASGSNNGSASAEQTSLAPLLFIAAPIFGLVIVILIGALFLISRSNNGAEVVKNGKGSDSVRTPTPDDSPTPEKTASPTRSETPTNSPSDGNNSTVAPPTPDSTEDIPATPKTITENEKIAANANSFLRKMALNDPNAFLTDAQLIELIPRVNQFKGSKALAENIIDAQKNDQKIRELAKSRNLTPQFLANAAILAKLNNNNGSVLDIAQRLLEPLASIRNEFRSDSADDDLLIIAAQSNNTSGTTLRTTASGFGERKTGNARTFRSIWFFKANGKLTDAQFDYALRYLAVGAITQNPREFNVQADKLVF